MKKIIFLAFLFSTAACFLPEAVLAQKKSKKPKPPVEEKIVIPDSTAEELPVPDPIGLVSDFGNVFTPGQEDTLSAIIKTLKDSTGDEIAIVAWDTLHLVPEEMDAYVQKLTEAWEIGEKNKTNGIIIAFSVQLRKIKIENSTGGLTEKEAWQIVHKIMLPYFAQKNFYGGTLMGLQAVIKILKTE
ncbi:MAG: TPM domain-containing protein [Ferruginibacter sp.]